MLLRRALLIVLFLLPVSSLAHDYTAGDIAVDHPWSMPLPPVSVNGAAYITIKNSGSEADRLLGASSPISETVELHAHVHENGVMKMQQVEGGVEVAGGDTVAFAPGGLHLMLVGLKEPLAEGGKFPVTLQFELAGELEVIVHVENKSSGEPKTEEMDHSSHSSNQAE